MKPMDNMYMKEYSYTVEEHNERNIQFSPKHLGGFSYAGDRQDGETTPLSSPQDKLGSRPSAYKRATATAFTYKPPEITRTTVSSPLTRPLSTYRSAMNAPTTTTSSILNNKSSTLPSSRLKESTSAYSWSEKQQEDRSERAERQFAQLINVKDEISKESPKKEKSASTDKMNALFGSGKSKFGTGDKTTSSQTTNKSTKSSIFSSFMKSSSQDEKVEKKKQLSQSNNVLEQKKTSSTSSLINKYNNLTSSPKVIGSTGQLRTGQSFTQQEPVKQTKLDSDSESSSSSENSMDEYASEDLKTDPTMGPLSPSYLSGTTQQQPRSTITTGSLPRTTQRYEPQPTVRTSLTIQPTQLGSSTLDSNRTQIKPTIQPKPAIPTKPSQLTNKVSPYESKFSSPSPIGTRTQTLLNSNYLKENFLKDKTTSPPMNETRFGSTNIQSPTVIKQSPQVPIKLQSSTIHQTSHQPSQSSPSYLSSSPKIMNSSSNLNNTDRMPYSPYNNAIVTTTTVPHVQQPKITHLSRKRTVKKSDGSVEEDEELIEPQTFVSTATFTPSKRPMIVGARPIHNSNSNLANHQIDSSYYHANHIHNNVKNLSKLVL